MTVIDDFAHHPTAVAGTIEAIAQRHSSSRVVALLEPRTNTSRRALFQNDYVEALARADRVAIAEVGDEPIYSNTGEVTECLSSSAAAQALRDRGLDAQAFGEIDEIVSWVVAGCQEGDVVLVMSNGAFGGIWEKLLTALENAGSSGCGQARLNGERSVAVGPPSRAASIGVPFVGWVGSWVAVSGASRV